jgi:ATP-dependent Clp protease ATP-binding subunit ClpA
LNDKGQAWEVTTAHSVNGFGVAEFESILDRPGYALIGEKKSGQVIKLYVITETGIRYINHLPSRTAHWGLMSYSQKFDLSDFSLDSDGNLHFKCDANDPWYEVDWNSKIYHTDGRAFDAHLGPKMISELVNIQPARELSAPPSSVSRTQSVSNEAPEAAAKGKAINGKRENPLKAKANEVGDLDGQLREKVFGQDHLTRKLAEHFSRLKAGLPTVLVLTGPSGVGKSHLGRQFAKVAFGDPKLFLEVDGTEYQMPIEKGSIQHHKLVGAESAYQGQQKGVLTEWIRANKGTGVLLINEADKMHPDIWKRLMELFERGRITDGDGVTHQADRLVIILTSNRGATLMFPPSAEAWSQEEIDRRMKSLNEDAIKKFYMTKNGPKDKFELPREVINRISEWLVAGPLTDEAVIKIATVTVGDYNEQLESEHGLKLVLSPEAVRHLALTGFKSTDDGRQVVRQTLKYLKDIEAIVGLKWDYIYSSSIKVKLEFDKQQTPVFLVTDGKQKLKIAAPVKPHDNPLQDKSEVERLLKLPLILRERIIGQESAIESISQAVTAARSDASRRRPVSFFLIGTTGTGKTEIGRGLSLALYGSSDRVNVLSMGEINSEGGWMQKFGYAGSESASEFEQALISNPEGGVLVFDEVSNMGGMSAEMKRTLFKKLYELTEEGKWTSPLSGKVYDLSKYVFVFTGNDGETLFQGVSSDDMRMAIWRDNNARDKVRALLIAAGVPEAFINRMADAVLMKPLTLAEINGVVLKLLKDRIKAFETQHRGMKIKYSDELVRRIADSFFTNDRGARGIRSMLEDRFPAVLTYALINSQLDLSDLHDVEVHLGVSDNKEKRPYLMRSSPERKVEIVLDVMRHGRLLRHQALDVTELAAPKVLMGFREARLTAIHEAGHAVVNDSEATGERMRYITIEGGFAKGLKYLGYAAYEPVPGQYHSPTRAIVVRKIARLYAGSLAQLIEGLEPDAGWSNDLEKIRQIASTAVIKWGLEPSLVGVRVNQDGETILTPAQNELAEEKIKALIEEGRVYAENKLKEKRALMRAVAADLLRKGYISGSRYDEIAAAYERREAMRGGMCRALFGR